MKKFMILFGIAICTLSCLAQISASRNLPQKTSLSIDSTKPATERQQSLLSYRNIAIKEKKKIFILPLKTKNTKQQDIAYIGILEKKEVVKVDLSTIVSKYINETEKNLSLLFEKAKEANLILFFEEADDLFSKSTEPAKIAARIQLLSAEKNVTAIFSCKDNCEVLTKRTRHITLN